MRTRASRSLGIALWLIALLVATGALATPASLSRLAAADPVIRFSPPSATVESGTTFVLDVVVDNVVDLGGFDFTVSFNPAVVQVQDVTLGSFLGSTGRTVAPLGPNIDNTAGSLTFGGFSFGAAGGPGGTGTVAQVTLQAMGAGSSTPLTFTAAQLPNTQGVVQTPLTMSPGLVTVSGAVATQTATAVASFTPTRTSTPTEPPASTWTPTLTATLAPSRTPTMTEVPTLTGTPVVPTATATEQATVTPSPTPTRSEVATPAVTLTPTLRRYFIHLPAVLRDLR